MTFSPVIAGTEPYMQIRRQMRPLAASGKGTPPDSDQEAGSANVYYKGITACPRGATRYYSARRNRTGPILVSLPTRFMRGMTG